MIADFPIGDSLHLIDLGIMKKCLIGWRDGKFGNYKTKWSAQQTADISKYLSLLRLPSEIHRAVRGLDCLNHWKGTEFRTFFYYIGIVILKSFLPEDVFDHFLLFFCAVTICSSDTYSSLINVAESLLKHYIEQYVNIYGEDYITSNIHNVSHLIDDVKKFGILSSFSAYPFESKLYQIKNLIRSGHRPLTQVAKRISEVNQLGEKFNQNQTQSIPQLKKQILTSESSLKFAKIDFASYSLCSDTANKWFLTKNNQIVSFDHATQHEGVISVFGNPLKHINEYFVTPIKSCNLNIFQSKCEKAIITAYTTSDIKCKMVGLPVPKRDTKMVFIPLIHTL